MSHFTIAGVGSGPGDRAIKLNKGKNCTITHVKISKGLSISTTIDIENISVSDTITYTIETGSGLVYYNASADDNFNQTITVGGPGYIDYNYTFSYNDTFDIQVNEIHDQLPLVIIYPNSSYINITPVNYPYVNFTFTTTPSIDPPIIYTINYVNISNLSDYYIFNGSVNWTYPGDLTNTIVLPILARVNLTAFPEDGYVLLHWRDLSIFDGSSIQGYKIYRSTATGPEVLIAEVGNNTDFYKDENVRNDVTYYYRVTVDTERGEGPPSNEASAYPHHEHTIYDIMTVKYAGLIWWLWIIISVAGTLMFMGMVDRYFDRK
jgi:hypothetical protein